MTGTDQGSPLFSVVVPTRNRPDTLRYCLQTCLEQDFEDYEIVVADNYGSSATRDVVEAAGSSRIRYVRSAKPLAMSANWENGVSAARGQYVTLIGDDDGLMPFALRELSALLHEHDYPRAIHWDRGTYTWPTIVHSPWANFLHFPVHRTKAIRHGRALLRDYLDFQVSGERLPTIHTSIVHRGVLDELRSKAGRVFVGSCPDDFTSVAFGWMLDEFLSVSVPMHLAGVSHHSNAIATNTSPYEDAIAIDYQTLNEQQGFTQHPHVPDLLTRPTLQMNSFERARELLFPDAPGYDYDRKAMAIRYVESIWVDDPATRERQRQLVRESLADRPDLQEWFDREAPIPQPSPRTWFGRETALGYNDGYATINTSTLGVENVADAVRLATAVIGVDSRPIAWGGGSPPDRSAELAELRKALHAAEGDRAASARQLRRHQEYCRRHHTTRPRRRLAQLLGTRRTQALRETAKAVRKRIPGGADPRSS